MKANQRSSRQSQQTYRRIKPGRRLATAANIVMPILILALSPSGLVQAEEAPSEGQHGVPSVIYSVMLGTALHASKTNGTKLQAQSESGKATRRDAKTRPEKVQEIIVDITSRKRVNDLLDWRRHDGKEIPNIEFYEVKMKIGNDTVEIQYFPEKPREVFGLMTFFVTSGSEKESISVSVLGEIRSGSSTKQEKMTMILDTDKPVGAKHREFWVQQSDKVINSVFEYFATE